MTEAWGGSFDKDRSWEKMAQRMNDLLEPIQREAETRDTVNPTIVHVVGPPRSGTTLAMQILANCSSIGFIDNIAAAFWRAPVVGIRLSRHVSDERAGSNWESFYGQTRLPHEPHEFGYFWRELLGYQSMRFGDRNGALDYEGIRATLAAMGEAFGRAMVFKSFLAAWHLAELHELFPQTLVVRIRRSHVDSAMSMLGMREALGGDRLKWASIYPPSPLDWTKLTPAQQVAGQAVYADHELDHQVSMLPSSNVLELRYEELCEEPQRLLDWLGRRLAAHGDDFAVTTSPILQQPRKANSQDPDFPEVVAAVGKLGRTLERQGKA